MASLSPDHATIRAWIAAESIPFSLDSSASFNAALDRLIAQLDPAVELLGIGEPLHGGEEFLALRNRLFGRLVEAHGYSAIAVESSFPRGYLVNEFVAGRAGDSFDAIESAGFSHHFGRMKANRELVEWMRRYNADPSHATKLRFYGFDAPLEMTHSDSPRQHLRFAIDYLVAIDPESGHARRRRIEELIGPDADWENPAAMMDASKSVGLSSTANGLRLETEELISELRQRRPELVAASDSERYAEAEHHAASARQLLNYHAALARPSPPHVRLIEGLGIRDVMMADNLAYIAARERGRGKVLAFAHNSHLKRGRMQWQLGPHALAWWPAGAQLVQMLGPRYAVIGVGIGAASVHGIGQPEPGTLEQLLTATPGPARLVPTHLGRALQEAQIAALRTRSTAGANPSYFPFTAQSLTDFDWLLLMD